MGEEVSNISIFPLWKSLHGTVPFALTTNGSAFIDFTRMLLGSSQFADMFLCKNQNYSPEEYECMSQSYTAFTIWFLGRYHHFMHNSNVTDNILEIAIDCQLRILYEIKNAQPYIFRLIAQEYILFLRKVTEVSDSSKVSIEAFVPKNDDRIKKSLDLRPVYVVINSIKDRDEAVKKSLKIIEFFLISNVESCVLECIKLLNFILNSPIIVEIKLIIYNILIKFFQKLGIFSQVVSNEILICIAHLQDTFNLILNKTISMDAKYVHELEDIFVLFLTLHSKINKAITSSLQNIVNIIIRNKDNFNIKTINSCLKFCDEHLNSFEVFSESNVALCSIIDEKIYNDILLNVGNSVGNNMVDIRIASTIWDGIYIKIFDKISIYNGPVDNFLGFEQTLQELRNLLIMLGKIKIKLLQKFGSMKYHFIFISQIVFLSDILYCYERYFVTQDNTVKADFKLFFDILFHSLCISPIEDLNITMKIILHKLFCDLNMRFDVTADSFMKLPDPKLFSKNYNFVLQVLKSANIDIIYILDLLKQILSMVKTGLITTKNTNIFGIVEKLYAKLIHGWEPEYLTHLLPCLTYSNTSNTNYKESITTILNKVIQSRNKSAIEGLSRNLRSTICALSQNYTFRISYSDNQQISSSIICSHFKCTNQRDDLSEDVYIEEQISFLNYLNRKDWSAIFLRELLIYSKISKSVELKINIIKCLPCFAKHLEEFHKLEFVETWIEFIGHSNSEIRKAVNNVLKQVLKHTVEDTTINEEYKNEFSTKLFDYIYENSKVSIQESRYDLQLSLLEAIEQVAQVPWQDNVLKYIRLLQYFIIIRTSDYKHLAAHMFIKFSKPSLPIFFNKHKRKLCSDIIHLSIINHAVQPPYSLSDSLSVMAPLLGHDTVSGFLRTEVDLLLSHLVTYVRDCGTHYLIQELANAATLDGDIRQMLEESYGHIFLQITLGNEGEAVSRYVEGIARDGVQLKAWRKMHFKVIINHLLLNFYENKEQVIGALKLLLSEYNDDEFTSPDDIPNALQGSMFGVLQYFEHHLIGDGVAKMKALRSLPSIFQFIGSDRLTPLKYKIIAILRSCIALDYGPYPRLVCDVWDTFVRCCHIEVIAPQLATVVVSLLPLMTWKENVEKINELFRYLIISHASTSAPYLPHLFFLPLSSLSICPNVTQLVLRHLPEAATTAMVNTTAQAKDYLNGLIGHLRHETVDVRLMALEALKKFLSRCRGVVEGLILNYNGVDGVIVDLIDILTSTCRDKEESLRLASADCIGELGAIEPSHLPRRKNGRENSDQQFSFYADDADFIVASLNELTRAMLSEKNTKGLDRIALSIQEILRVYSISPDKDSPGHALWQRFPKSQQLVMQPLLKSRYKVVHKEREIPINVAVYNSSLGGSFNTWSFTWSHKLVSSVSDKLKPLFETYLISMQQDQRMLIHFLPQILLHAIIDAPGAVDEIYGEFTAVLESIMQRKIQDNNTDWKELHNEDCQMPVHNIKNDNKKTQCIKVVFVLLDYLDRWVREYEFQKMGNPGSGDGNSQHGQYQQVKAFLESFDHMQLARCNYYCREYARALRHLEDYVEKNPAEKNAVLPAFAKVYAELGETDGVTGVAALTTTAPSTEQRILTLEVSGKLVDAVACYERLPRPLTERYARGLVRCYLQLDNVDTALAVARNIIKHNVLDGYDGRLLELQAEPLWRLGRWDELEDLLDKPVFKNNDEFQINIGKALLNFYQEKNEAFEKVIRSMRRQLITCLAAVSLDGNTGYQHEYDRIAQLHAITELEQIKLCSNEIIKSPGRIKELIGALANDWQLRLKVVQETVRIREPLLCLRRAALVQSARVLAEAHPTLTAHTQPPINALIANLWLESGRVARRADMSQQAYSYLLKAEGDADHRAGDGSVAGVPASLFIQRAKLHWAREECEEALATLNYGIDNLAPATSHTNHPLLARARLLVASYNDKLSNVDTDVNIRYYKAAVDAHKDWEKSLVMIGQYYDKVLSTFPEEERDVKASEMQIHMINFFGKSLLYGCKYVHQSMPRMLSIWFDYGTRVLHDKINTGFDRRDNLLKMSKLIDASLKRLPTFVFLTAFSQLISRICHPQKEVYVQLKRIIVHIILHYPQHTLWMLTPVIKSSYSVRAKRCADILADSELRSPPMMQLIGDFTALAEQFIDLCNKPIGVEYSTISVASLKRSLPRMLSREDMSAIMMPTERARKMVIPVIYKEEMDTYNPFPEPKVHIVAIQDEMQVLNSMQRPRKITLRGSDGKLYVQMLKPKDDLRRDFRLMEFNDVVNGLLQREPEARQNRLAIRLYSVAPLNEECGLIEWVNNLVGLRPTLMALYRQKGLGMRIRALKETCCNVKDPLAKKLKVFTEVLIPNHPPLLHLWFRRTFPDVQTWLTARNTYTRTVAVMSVVGYILGLGDRHGENIQLDSTCGDAVHVDFNCLFNKGETFEWPERVPFRLTHNMVAAMGPLGVEGIFRKSCISTLRVLRTHTCTLMSIVTPFVYDPMVSWPRPVAGTSNPNAERTNEQAVEHVRNIHLRLGGQIKGGRFGRGSTVSIPLSVDGQVNKLIVDATSIENLCQMYFGWGPYL